MPFLNVGKEFVALRLGSALSGLFIGHVGIGTGSAPILVTDTTLVNEIDRTSITGSPNFDTARKVTFTADFSSSTMSGTDLTEFGFFDQASGTGFPGSAWQREGFGSVVFDGTNELKVTGTIEVF